MSNLSDIYWNEVLRLRPLSQKNVFNFIDYVDRRSDDRSKMWIENNHDYLLEFREYTNLHISNLKITVKCRVINIEGNINGDLLWLIIVVHLKGKPESIKALDQITCIVVLVCNFLHPSKIF